MPDEYGVINVAKMPGINNIYPVPARSKFAKAWLAEYHAGETTPEAEALLEEAVQLIEAEEAKLLVGA